MPLKNVQKVTAYIIAALGLTLLAFSGELGVIGTAAVAVSFIASWWIEEPHNTKRNWQQAWNAITVAVFIIQFIRWWMGLGFVTSTVQFAAFLQINKMYNRRNQTDYDHILVLSLLHLIGSSILFSDIEYAVLFIFYVIITPWHMMLGQIRREVEAKYLEKKDAESVYNFKRVLKSKRLISGKLLASTALLSIPIYIFTAIFFLIFPRIGFGILAGQSKFSRGTVGFSDTIRLGDLIPLSDNPLAVARVEFPGDEPDRETLRSIHWRATAYDKYDGRQWLRTLDYGSSVRLRDTYYVLTDDGEKHRDLDRDYYPMTIVLQPLYPKILIIPEESPCIEMIYKQPIRAIRKKLSWGPAHEIRYADPFDAGISYTVHVSRDFYQKTMPAPFGFQLKETDRNIDKYLQRPDESDQFKKLSNDFNTRYSDPMARAEAIEQYLSTQFDYTRSEYWKVPGGKTPVDAFLFDWKKGNCEYFSTSMVLLLRAGGIPARNVAGFLGGQWNKIGNYLIIREGDAHSWVEAYFPEHGWVIFDPTPASGSPDIISNPYLSAMLQFFDVISLGWQKHVIAYDLSHQSKFLKASYSTFMQYRRRMGGIGRKAEYHFGPAQKRLLVVLAMLIFWALYFLYFRKENLLRAPLAYRQSVSARKAVNLMSELDRRLEVLGLYRPMSRPPLKHSHRISPSVNDSATLFEVVDIYNETRFGHKVLEKTQYKSMVQRIRALQ